MSKAVLKRGISLVLCALMLLPMLTSVSFAQDEGTAPTFNVSTIVQAEEALLRGATKVIDDENALGGKAVKFNAASGEPGNQSALSGSETVNFSMNFTILETDTYKLRIKVYAADAGCDSLWLSLNNEDYRQLQPSPSSLYYWYDVGSYVLDPGTVSLNIIRREAGFVLDAVELRKGQDYDAMASDYSPRVYTEGEVEYPELITSESIGTLPKFKDGDRVAFIGDSITHGTSGGYYHKLLFNYYATRYPNVSFSVVNKGIDGDSVGGANNRLNHDIFDEIDSKLGGFNKVVIMLGTNDMRRAEYFEGNELLENAETTRKNLIDSYTNGIKKLVNSIVAKDGIEQVILQSPPLFDEFVGEANKPASPGFSNVIRRAGQVMYELSQTNDKIYFVDVNTPQTIVEMYNLEKYGNTFTFVADRVHPSEKGHYIMTYAFLKAQGESGEVATVDIDVSGQTHSASNATVENLSATNRAVFYEYTPASLPIAAEKVYREAEALFPVTDELNREIIRVKGLNKGNYDIKMDGTVVATVSAAQLEEGVNIADLENNPGQQQALKIHGLATEKLKAEAEYRTFVRLEIQKISNYGLDATSNATLISSAQSWIDANKADTSKASGVKELEDYISYKNKEERIVQGIKDFETEAYKRNKPSKHSVLIEVSSKEAQSVAKTVRTDYELAQSVLRIVPESMPKGVSAQKVVFSDASGNVLTEVPTAPNTDVTVRMTVANNTDKVSTPVVWAASYKEATVNSIATKRVELAAGETKTVELKINTKLGSDDMRVGAWKSYAEMSPYSSTASLSEQTQEQGIKAIYVNGSKLEEFDESVYSYTYYVHKLQSAVPYVNAVAKNSAATISVVQASKVGESATVTAGDKTYTIKFVNEPLPVLEDIKIDGVTIDGFGSYKYSYDVTLENGAAGNVTASAADGITFEIDNKLAESKKATITVTSPFGATRTYTLKSVNIGTPGTISNVKHNGAKTTSVYGIPSLGAKVVNYSFDEAEKTASEVYEQLKADKPYENEAYSMYSNRPLVGMWTTGNGTAAKYYGYHTQFMYADTGAMFINKNVTRLFKPDTDRPDGSTADATKMYEFDISKGATVYIATRAQSTYIESLNKGWTYENAAKYKTFSPKYTDMETTINGKDAVVRVPVAGTQQADNMNGSVYYKHFNAGETVEIPALREGKVYRETGIFIIWDECNTEEKLFDIFADGESVGFDGKTLEYTVKVSGSAVPTISVAATAGANAEVVQATSLDGAATVSACGKTYTVRFEKADLEPGKISNVKWNGTATTSVYGAPNIGINPPNIYGEYTTDTERIAATRLLADSQYDDVKYAMYTDRVITGIWSSGNAYNQKFTLANTPEKYLYGEKITRLVKSSNDAPKSGYADKVYEFDIDKPAMVYITTSNSKAQTCKEVRSTYIEGLNAGWQFDYDFKYTLMCWGTGKSVTDTTSSAPTASTVYVPNGATNVAWGTSGSVYYKHFEAGSVQIPAFSATSSDMQMNVYIKWDHLNDEAQIFDIRADGTSLKSFSPTTYSYVLTLEEGSSVPQISVSASAGANATVVQAASLDEKATVTACGKTYTISFVQAAANMNLKNLTVDGMTISGFNPETTEYTYTVERGITTIPKLAATAELDTNTVTVKQAEKMPGKAKITVASAGGATNEYTVKFVKTGTPGVVTNLKIGGNTPSATDNNNTVKAVPSLGAELVNIWDMFDNDADRVAYLRSDTNYNNTAYAQYTNRTSYNGNVWETYSASEDVYGYQMEFILTDYKDSMLISPDVTRLIKPSDDPCTTEELAKNAYSFNISKDATVYITTTRESEFIANQGWTYETGNKYRVYSPARSNNHIAVISTGEGDSATTKRYYIPNGNIGGIGNAAGSVYKKHFTKDETVAVPAFAVGKGKSSRQTNVFIVWDDCNDERNIYGVRYSIGDSIGSAEFNKDTLNYDITVPQGTTVVPTLLPSATRPVNVQVSAPAEYTNGKATITMAAELEADNVKTYTFNFYVDSSEEDDVRLSSVKFDGANYDGFEMYTRDYAIDLAYGVEYPTLTAVANSDVAGVSIIQPSENGGTGIIKVTSESGNYTAEYKFVFTKLDYIPARTEIMKFKDGKKSIITIVHDDGDVATTMPYLDKEMQKNGLKATVGMITTNVANTDGTLKTAAVAKWKPYFESGRFNLASHSFTHSYMGQSDSVAEPTQDGAWGSPVEATYAGKMTKEIKGSQETLREAFPNQRVLAFIKPGVNYPVGKSQVSEEAYQMIEETYISMRNTGGGVDTVPPKDWYNVKSYMVNGCYDDPTASSNDTAAYWKELADKAIENNGWLVYLFHGITPDASASEGAVLQSKASILFDKLGDDVESGDVWCAFFDEATMYIKESQTASVVAKDYTQDASKKYLSVKVTDKMDDTIYDCPITIKVAVPDAWKYVKNVQNGVTEIKATFVESGVTYAYVNVVPDKEAAIVSEAQSGDYLTEISVDSKALEGFEPTKYHYNVTLPTGTTTAPTVYANGAVVTQATLDSNGEGAATVKYNGDEYTIYFETEKVGPVVFLKLDDLREGTGVRNAFKNAIAYCDEVGVKANVGVIAVSLEDSEGVDKTAYYNEIKGYAAGGHEIWNHGYYHNETAAAADGYSGEFRTGTYDEQLAQLNNATALFKEKTGLEPTSFGAPGNGTNTDTARVFNAYNEAGEYAPITNAYYYNDSNATGVTGYMTAMDFEVNKSATWNPNLDYRNFVKAYQAAKSKDYLILQTHPAQWGQDAKSTHYKIFKDQIDYLIMQGARFMTGSEYAEAISEKD